jgi:hypothetical protein
MIVMRVIVGVRRQLAEERANEYVEWWMVPSRAFAYVSWPVHIRTGWIGSD